MKKVFITRKQQGNLKSNQDENINNYNQHMKIEDNLMAMRQRKLFNSIISECREELNRHKKDIE